MDFTTPKDTKARKRHRCSWCAEAILPATTYTRYVCFGDDGVGTVKVHPECYTAMQRFYEEDPYFEWAAGDCFTRGCTCESGDVGHGTYPTCTKG